jgi:hypothetical protein
MSTETMRAEAYDLYRARLEVITGIPKTDSDHDIREVIKVGSQTYSLVPFLKYCTDSLPDCLDIISSGIPNEESSPHQPFSVGDSALWFRVAHIVALAESIFGNGTKARRWLMAPKKVFSGAAPMAMVSTIEGVQKVEQMLIQAMEGITF